MLILKRRPDSPNWHIEGTLYTPQGKIRLRETTGCAERKDAETYLNQRENKLRAELANERDDDISLELASLNYADMKETIHPNDAKRIALMNDFFNGMMLSQIDGTQFNRFCARILMNRKASTINRYRSNLSSILNHAKSNSPHIGINKIPTRETKKTPPRYLGLDEQENLLNAYNPIIRPLIYCLCFQGCRIGEALRIQWADLDLDQRRLNLWVTKNGDFRSLPMHPRLHQILRSLNRERYGHVFVTPLGKPYNYVRKTNGSPIKTAHRNALKRAGIRNFKVHNWRSHWASHMALKGANAYELMALGGWRSTSSIERYVRLNPEHLRTALERLD